MNYTSVSRKNWVLKKYDKNIVLKYCEKYLLDEIIARLLVIKKINEKKLKTFLKPTVRDTMPDPYILKDMDIAVNRIQQAIYKNEKIGIFGDYDVDGASSTALLVKFFNNIKHPYEILIPDRIKDGYGPTSQAFDKLIKKKVNIIITVDCGTVSFDAIDYAYKNKINVIILDHHQSEVKLPKAHALVNPNRIDCKSKLNYLCASGVTFLFLVSLDKLLKKNNWYKKKKILELNLINYLDLVCLGTICDVVPLVDFNRTIVRQGLKILKKRTNIGISTLYDLTHTQGTPNSYHVGYLLGPIINAGGRVGKSSYGSELLSTNDEIKASKIAQELILYNNKRKILQNELIKLVEKKILKEISNPVLVLSGTDWHEGVIGIIAAKIKDKFLKPTILISFTGQKGKGSARSVYGFDIGAVLVAASNEKIILKGGGHKMAGGFEINKNNIDKFKKFLFEKFKKSKASNILHNEIYIDGLISPTALNENFYKTLDLVAPYGSGNSEPIFLIENVKIIKAIKIAEEHIKIVFTTNTNITFKAMAFNSVGSEMENYLSNNYKKKINIIGKLSLNEWQGRRNIEFIIEDISVIKNK